MLARNGYAGGFLDLTRLLGGVMGSNLVQSGCNSFARVLKVLFVSIICNIIHGMLKMSVKVTDSGQKWLCWRFFGPNSTSRRSYRFILGVEWL